MKRSRAVSPPRAGRDAWNGSPISPPLYLDGTHNPAGARELLKFWQENFAGRRIFLVYGAMRDKAVDEIAGLLFPRRKPLSSPSRASRARFRRRPSRR